MWYNIFSLNEMRTEIMQEMDNNAHSVFLLYYHLIMVTKYRRKVINDDISPGEKRYLSISHRITESYLRNGTTIKITFT